MVSSVLFPLGIFIVVSINVLILLIATSHLLRHASIPT